ncbi:MAG: aminotransferase, partial [Gammaproteobacteria bacterium]|nr:aminotransferase [Gammaproteobacteria bacterium]
MNVVDWPAFSDDEIEAVTAVLRSGRVNYWTGPHGKAFERD